MCRLQDRYYYHVIGDNEGGQTPIIANFLKKIFDDLRTRAPGLS